MSKSHHPQTDGLSEVMNRMVENFIRCYCALNQKNWDELLPAAECACNSAVTEYLGMSPFEVDFGWQPRSPVDLLQTKECFRESVNEFIYHMGEALWDATFAHELAKARQSAYSARKTHPHPYQAGESVWLEKVLFTDVIAKVQNSHKL